MFIFIFPKITLLKFCIKNFLIKIKILKIFFINLKLNVFMYFQEIILKFSYVLIMNYVLISYFKDVSRYFTKIKLKIIRLKIFLTKAKVIY